MRLQGKIAAVTGAGSGLGRGIAVEFAVQGAEVIVIDRDPDGAERTVGAIAAAGGKAHRIVIDIADRGQVEDGFRQIKERFRRLDILVNNAGITGRSRGDGPVGECLPEAWDEIVGVNLRGTFLCSRHAVNLMTGQGGGGAIVNVSSVLGLVGCQEHFTSHAYQASKAGIIGLSRSIAAYYAKHGIRCNVIAPGLIESPATGKVRQDAAALEFVRRMQPLGELGRPEDVARAAVYFASDESAFVTGQVLAVDGGWTMQ
ncbi:SDR family NAD(P)-dependent oxidoreductase [Paenibacillus hodogayensis]|uniref:SDR family NAD(P)-dependent oxidoreductase n=1 Tax=Paenibacillus hodogayensis TaxID=279208 RepID=A0ABV5VY88_9BACL